MRSLYNKVELIHLRLGDDELCCTLCMSTLTRTTGCQTLLLHQQPATFSMWTKTICQKTRGGNLFMYINKGWCIKAFYVIAGDFNQVNLMNIMPTFLTACHHENMGKQHTILLCLVPGCSWVPGAPIWTRARVAGRSAACSLVLWPLGPHLGPPSFSCYHHCRLHPQKVWNPHLSNDEML